MRSYDDDGWRFETLQAGSVVLTRRILWSLDQPGDGVYDVDARINTLRRRRSEGRGRE
jgi:hypothetical protein